MRPLAVTLVIPLVAGCGLQPGADRETRFGSGSTTARCLALAQEYAAALPDALLCDPSSSGPCSEQRPLAVYEQRSDGQLVLEGLCDCHPVAGWVNPARTAALDEVLARFAAQGCELGRCPCPPMGGTPPPCRLTASGTGTCG